MSEVSAVTQIIILNGSPKPNGYWANERRGDSLVLDTHCLAAEELARAAERGDAIYVNLAGGIDLRGPVTLVRWEANAGFFKLHLEGVEQQSKPMRGPHAAKVLPLLKKGQHLVVCGDGNPTYVSLEHPRPQPSPVEVEKALSDACALRPASGLN